jgi:hypothetical protein
MSPRLYGSGSAKIELRRYIWSCSCVQFLCPKYFCLHFADVEEKLGWFRSKTFFFFSFFVKRKFYCLLLSCVAKIMRIQIINN